MKKKKESFLQAVFALMFSQIAVKILGMVYSLYLTNKNGFGDKGNAICMSAYQIYAIFLCICSIGIPNAISKMVAENLAVGDVIGSRRVFKVSLAIFSGVGMICSIFLYCISDFIAQRILGISAAENILKILAPSIVFVSISSVIRGYFNGKQKIRISAKTQTFEQIFKTILTIILVEFFSKKTNYNTDIMAKMSMFAASIATIISFLYTLKEFFSIEREDRGEMILTTYKSKQTVKSILMELFFIVLPISITSFFTLLESNIDSITIIRLLKNKIGEDLAREKYGILSSKVNLLTNLALALNGSVAVALVPEISKANAKRNLEDLEKKINFSFLITMFMAIPIMLIMGIYAKEIINLLYPNANKGAELLRLSSITIIFTVLTQTMSGILQGIGKLGVHLKIMFLIMPLKILLNCIFISNPELLEKGAILSSLICDILIFVLIKKKLKEELNLKIEYFNFLLKLLLIALISAFVSKIILLKVFINLKIKFILEIIVLGIIYIGLTFVFNIFDLKTILKSLKIKKN